MTIFGISEDAAIATLLAAILSSILALVMAVINWRTQKNINATSAKQEEELERLKAELSAKQTIHDARISYEFDARKKLYDEIEPLFFLLFDAAENSYYRIASLVRTEREGNLGLSDDDWLAYDGYYLRSTIYKIFLPLSIYRLIQNSATFVDIHLDSQVRLRYFLLKISYYIMTDDFEFARLEPELAYDPNHQDWESLSEQDPGQYYRQALVIGHLDRLIDAFIVFENGSFRPLNYGEFENKYKHDQQFKKEIICAKELLFKFGFRTRPILARALIAHAYTMRLLLYTYARTTDQHDLDSALARFVSSNEAKEDLCFDAEWYHTNSRCIFKYLSERITWINPKDYDL